MPSSRVSNPWKAVKVWKGREWHNDSSHWRWSEEYMETNTFFAEKQQFFLAIRATLLPVMPVSVHCSIKGLLLWWCLSGRCLTFTDPEHLGSALGTYALRCWFSVLHRYGFFIFHFLFCPAFYTVSLHRCTPLYFWWLENRTNSYGLSIPFLYWYECY